MITNGSWKQDGGSKGNIVDFFLVGGVGHVNSFYYVGCLQNSFPSAVHIYKRVRSQQVTISKQNNPAEEGL